MSREASVASCWCLWDSSVVRRELPAAGQPAGLGCQRHCPAHRCCKFLPQSCTDFTQSIPSAPQRASCSLSFYFSSFPHSFASLDFFSTWCSITTFSYFLFSSFFLLLRFLFLNLFLLLYSISFSFFFFSPTCSVSLSSSANTLLFFLLLFLLLILLLFFILFFSQSSSFSSSFCYFFHPPIFHRAIVYSFFFSCTLPYPSLNSLNVTCNSFLCFSSSSFSFLSLIQLTSFGFSSSYSSFPPFFLLILFLFLVFLLHYFVLSLLLLLFLLFLFSFSFSLSSPPPNLSLLFLLLLLLIFLFSISHEIQYPHILFTQALDHFLFYGDVFLATLNALKAIGLRQASFQV